MKLRRILFAADQDENTSGVIDIVENDIPCGDEEKARAAMRRKILRELDKQIDQILAGAADKIVIIAIEG